MSKIKVMVVEDESIVAIDIAQRLESLGYAVVGTAPSGEKAIMLAEKTKPDLILMDIVLKGKIDGIQAADEIVNRFNIPVVYLTAYSDAKTLERAKLTEPYGYIIKPFEDRELHSTIEIALYNYKMELKLKESEEKYRMIVNSINDILFTLDKDEKFTMISEPQLDQYGIKADAFLGKTPLEIFGEQGEIHHQNNQKILKGENNIYNWTTNFSGEEISFQISLSPLKNSEGNIIGIIGLLRDISKEK